MQNTIKGFISDHFGNLSPSDIPNFIFALFLSALLNLVLEYLYRKVSKGEEQNSSIVVIGMGAAALITVVKHSLPLALGAIAILCLYGLRNSDPSKKENGLVFSSIVIGIGCGAGYGIPMIIFTVIVALFILLMGRRSNPSE